MPRMNTVTLKEAETRLPELADRVARGETIVITRDGKPLLDLVPHTTRKGGLDLEGLAAFKRTRGIDKIVTYIAPDFDDPLPEDFLITPLPDPDTGPR